MVTFHKQGVPVVDNLLTAMHQLSVGLNNWATSACSAIRVLGANTVNALRVSFNRTKVDRYNAPTVEPSDLGIKAFSYEPHRMNDVAGGFVAGHLSAGYGLTDTDAYQVSNDLTRARRASARVRRDDREVEHAH